MNPEHQDTGLELGLHGARRRVRGPTLDPVDGLLSARHILQPEPYPDQNLAGGLASNRRPR